jgi:drug/metabolite transporter (DMT)-like permease
MMRGPMISGATWLLASAFLHASWNAVLKREHDPQRGMLGILGFAFAFAAVAAFLWTGPGFPDRPAVGWTVAAGVFEGLYFATLAMALARATYGAVYAIARGGALLFVWPAAALVLHEPVTVQSAAGAALVAVGIGLVGLSAREHSSARGIAFAVACAASIAGYHLCYGKALGHGAAHAPVFALALGVAFPFAWGSVRAGGPPPGTILRPVDRRDLVRWLACGAVTTTSFLLFLVGLARSGAGVALTLRNTSIVFAQLLAVLLGEAMPARQLAGAVLIVIGAAMVALP